MANKKPKPLTTYTKLRLLHPRHSFKLLPKRHTSYPLLLFTLLLVGVFSLGWTAFASGDGGAYTVNAVVPAPPLPVAAEIVSPSDGAVLHEAVITVSGTCPPNSYVKLYRNGVFSGTALCQSNNSWYIQTSLTAGANRLYARDYNVTDQAGPASQAITVSYDPPQTTPAAPVDSGGAPTKSSSHSAGGSATSASANKTVAPPLVLSGEYTYQGVYVGQTFSEALTLAGGTAPYAVSIDWGDGDTDLSSHASAGNFTLQHSYQNSGDYKNSYVIKVSATDAQGQLGLLQMIAIITPVQTGNGASGLYRGSGPSSGATAESGSALSPYTKFWRVAAPVYGLAFVGLSSFWLGESREFELLRRHSVRLHRKRPLR